MLDNCQTVFIFVPLYLQIKDMALKKIISIRVSEEFHEQFARNARKLSEITGQRVDLTDLFWRIYDYGLPLLEQELMAEYPDIDKHLSNPALRIASAKRIAKTLLLHLQTDPS